MKACVRNPHPPETLAGRAAPTPGRSFKHSSWLEDAFAFLRQSGSSRLTGEQGDEEGSPRGSFSTLQKIIEGLPTLGQHPAIVTFDRERMSVCTYEELSQDVTKLAAGLKKMGVGPGVKAALLSWTSRDCIVACLAILRSGAIPVPLDPQTEERALFRVLDDSAASLLFTTREVLERVPGLAAVPGLTPVLLEDEGHDPRSWRSLVAVDGVAQPEAQPTDVAALFYSSGTTGSAKGVPLTHRNLTFQLHYLIEKGFLTGEDRILLPLPLHHVYPFAVGMLLPLAIGIPIVLPCATTGPQLVRAMKDGRATAVVGVPRLYDALCGAIDTELASGSALRAGLFHCALSVSTWLLQHAHLHAGKLLLRPLHRRFGPKLRIMASGGAALSRATAWKLEALGWEVAIGYGLTETSPLLTLNPPGAGRIGTVGKPLPGVEVRIQPSPSLPRLENDEPDKTGEVLARGPNVFGGYHHLPEKTLQAFTPEGWFRTGDLGYFDAEGYLHLTGRLSTVIVTEGGEKVQPEEVEEVYERCHAIREIGILEKDGKLVAVIVPQAAHAESETALQQAIRQGVQEISKCLPSYQRLSHYVLSRDALQRTRLGKIRRHLLAERYEDLQMHQAPGEEGAEAVQMHAQDEALLQNVAAGQVWDLLVKKFPSKHLHMDASPQLDLGMDSLDWLEVTLAIRRETGIELTEETIARIGSIRDLLSAVSASRATITTASVLDMPEDALAPHQRRWLRRPGVLRGIVRSALYLLCRAVTKIWFKLEVEGVENVPTNTPFVLAANHCSYLDAQMLAVALGSRRLRRTYWGGWTGVMATNPLNRLFSRLAQVIPVDPEHALFSSLAYAAAVLKRGDSLVWFPEGGMSPTGYLQPFKVGIGLLLQRFKTPVLPVSITGTREAMPPGRFWPAHGKITVRIGAPLQPVSLELQGFGRRPPERVANALHDAVLGLQRGGPTTPIRPHPEYYPPAAVVS